MTSAGHAHVVGGGVVGRLCALRLAGAGWRVELHEDDRPSASAAAAGMIAPASEAVLDGVYPSTAELWRRAAALWPPLARRLGLELAAAGALHTGPRPVLELRERTAGALGVAARWAPGGLLLPEDAHLEAAPALDRMGGALAEAGVLRRAGAVRATGGGLHGAAGPLEGELIVVAAGWGAAALADAAPELAALRPIKGQLLRLEAPGAAGPVIRAPGAYLVPAPRGWTVGATMEPGRHDLTPDPAQMAALRTAAQAVRPELADAPGAPAVGVRAAVADGRPLVGRSATGVVLATGLRRNGWLLGPLVAEAVAAYAEGRDPDAVLGGQARAWSPARLARPAQEPA